METNRRTTETIGLFFWLLLTFGVAAFGSQFSPGEWYQGLQKPNWTPPGWVFGPVWGLLYLMMGVAAWLVWRARSEQAITAALILYLVQLVLNGFWSLLFFGRYLIGVALVDLFLLVIVVAWTLAVFVKINKTAGFLLVPYLLWISFATTLNFQIWRLN